MIKLFLTLISLCMIFGQETEGTIMVHYETESLTEYEKIQQQKNLEEEETLSSSESASPVDTEPSKSESSRSLLHSLSTKQELNKELSSSNKALQKQYEDLLALYEDLQKKIEDYKNYSESSFEELEQEIQTIEEYNELLLNEGQKKETEENNERINNENANDDDYEPDEDKDELSLTAILAVFIVFLCFLLIYWKNSLERMFDEGLLMALYTLYENLAILLLLNAFTSLMHYLDPFEHLDLSDIVLALCVFSLIYAGFSIIILVVTQGFLLTWRNNEAKLCDLEMNLKNQEKILEDYPESLIKYYFTKQLFINSPYLLSIHNIKNLDFSEYLSKCLGKTLQDQFSMTLLGYALALASIISYRIILLYTYPYESYILLSFPLVISLILIVLILKLNSISKKLVPGLSGESFLAFDSKNLNTLPRPAYLEGNIPSVASSPRTFFCIPVHPCKFTFNYIFKGFIPSRHEMLFWFDSFGPLFIKYVLQGSLVSLHLWLTLYFCSFINGSATNPLLYISPLSYLLNTVLLLPTTYKLLTICTSIEMMKNRSHLESSLVSTKVTRSKTISKVYRQLKMIFRNFYMKNKNQPLTDFQNNFIEEIFQIYSNGSLEIINLDDVFSLTGSEINDDELRLFAKECMPVI